MKDGARMRMACFSAILMLALVLLVCEGRPAHAESQSRINILIIYPFDRSMPYNVKFFSGLTAALEVYDLNAFEIFQENLDLDRVESKEYLDRLSELYNIKYASKKLDVIITLSSYAFDFLIERCNSLMPGTTIISVGTQEGNYPSECSGAKIISVSAGVDVEKTIDLIVSMQPTLRKVYVVYGAHPLEGTTMWGHVQQVVSGYKHGPEFVFMVEKRYEELLDNVKRLDPNDAILFLGFLRDGAGKSYISQYVAHQLSEVASCPVYGISDTFMGQGIVGGSMSSVYLQGLFAGEKLIDISGLGKVVTLPNDAVVRSVNQVDEKQMVRWHLSESNVPNGYEVVNRSHSLLRDYKGHVVIALLFFFAQSMLVIRLLVLSRIRRTAEQQLRGTCMELETKQEELNRTRILQEQALENLRESEMTLQSILAFIPVGVLVIDIETKTVRIANRAAADLLSTPLNEMPESKCPECFISFIAENEPGVSQDGANSYEDRIVNGYGKESYVLKTADSFSFGGRTCLIGCLLDITRRKAAESEAHENEEQLVHADKMISLGIMAAGIAHEINNPNNFILLNAPILKRIWEGVLGKLDHYAEGNGDFFVGKLPYSRVRKHLPVLLQGIIEGSKRIKTIVQDMKEFVSRNNSEKNEKVDINAVLRSSLNLLASTLSKSTDNLRVEYGENIPSVAADAYRLEQVAINLILNGAESLVGKSRRLCVRTFYEPQKARVVLEVRDNGVGIEPENLKRVFDPFFTTKREMGGTGLGLSISQRIIEAFGGQILINSTALEGTTVLMELPACSDDQ